KTGLPRCWKSQPASAQKSREPTRAGAFQSPASCGTRITLRLVPATAGAVVAAAAVVAAGAVVAAAPLVAAGALVAADAEVAAGALVAAWPLVAAGVAPPVAGADVQASSRPTTSGQAMTAAPARNSPRRFSSTRKAPWVGSSMRSSSLETGQWQRWRTPLRGRPRDQVMGEPPWRRGRRGALTSAPGRPGSGSGSPRPAPVAPG